MTVLINKGWLHISNGTDEMKVYFSEASGNIMRDPKFKHYEGGTNIRYDLGKNWLEIQVKDIWFDSHDDLKTFIDKINEWQEAGTLTVGIIRNSSGNHVEFKGDGNGTTFSMLMPSGGLQGITKISRGDQQIYVIRSLRFSE